MTHKLIAQLQKLEKAVSYKKLPPKGACSFTYQPGQQPILVSAPHATAHQRRQFIKGEETFTAAFAQYLAGKTGSHALFSHYRSRDDPNWHPDSPYKICLEDIVKTHNVRFVLDLHGMSNRHMIGLALGSMNGRSCPDHEAQILRALQRHNFRQTTQAMAKTFPTLQWDYFVLNHARFTGGLTHHTITRFVSQQLGIPALQIELCTSLRAIPSRQESSPFAQQQRGFQAVLEFLQTLIESLAAAV